jgi:Carbohydrate esterase, sialic acid-specific acetylesterase
MYRSRFLRAAWAAFAVTLPLSTATTQAKTVKVFILAGQSNMEGKVQNKLLEHQAKDAKTKHLFEHLRRDGDWIVRDDVFIKFLNHKGGLTIGYGSRNRTGVELEFGTVMGDHFDAPVLLIKTAWGGHSLFKLFRSPSAGMPSDQKLEAELAKARKNQANRNKKRKRDDPLPTMDDVRKPYGSSYRNMMKEVQGVFANYGKMFPKLEGKKLELAGFVWFQGWNDQYGGAEKEYESNMRHFIEDVRKDLKAPNLPVVIGVMGQNGSKPAKGPMLAIQNAQMAMQDVKEFQGNVTAIRTDTLIDKAAEALYPTWRKNIKQWELTGSDHGYHYLGSAIWHIRMGHAFGDAMVALLAKQKN